MSMFNVFKGGGGGFDLADPAGIGKGNTKLNPARKAAVDPLGLFYTPPEAPVDEAGLAAAEEARRQGLRDSIDTMYGIGGSPEATAAAAQLKSERDQISTSTRDYYNDQLSRAFSAAERNSRFRLAGQGLQGGSVDVDSNSQLALDRNLGATRIEQAARQAAAGLDAARESERLNSIGLVNAGVGSEGISSAQAGLKNTLSMAQSQNRADLFGDLFAEGANASATASNNQTNAALLARFQSQLGTFFPTKTSGGNVTPSA